MLASSYKVLIIGCGNMAGGYDLLQFEDAMPLSHAKAFSKHGGFELAACVEPDFSKRSAFQKRWQVPRGFASKKELSSEVGQFDVISICSPTSSHAEYIHWALELKPKLIFCEKPVTSSLKDTQIAVNACAEHDVLIAVNYSRRWSPQVNQIKDDLSNKRWGVVRSVSAIYNKGILNNGSHMLDMLLYLFGSLQVTSAGLAINDFVSEDPSISATLQSEKGLPIQINVAHAQDYAFFEMQIVTEKGVINMEDGGARWRFRRAKQSETLADYSFLNSGEWVEPKGSYALMGAVANIFNALQYGETLASTGSNSLQAQILCEQIKQIAFA